MAVLPYIIRLEALSLAWMWDGAQASVGRWLDRSKQRKNFSAIADYHDPKYPELMGPAGCDATPRIKSNLAVRR